MAAHTRSYCGLTWNVLMPNTCEVVQYGAILRNGHGIDNVEYRGGVHGNIFCAFCPDALDIPEDCPGDCIPGIFDNGCAFTHDCPCFRRASESRLSTWRKWITERIGE